MDDLYAINAAKTEFREAYNTGEIERAIAILDDSFVDYSDGRRSQFFAGAKLALRAYLQDLLASYDARLVPIIIEIRLTGEIAVEYGWHELTLTPKDGGAPVFSRTRYVDVWRKDRAGNWKLAVYMDNADIADAMPAVQANYATG